MDKNLEWTECLGRLLSEIVRRYEFHEEMRDVGCRMMCRKKRGIKEKIGTRTGVLREGEKGAEEEAEQEEKEEVGSFFIWA